MELPINRHIDNFSDNRETGLVPNEESYIIYSQTIDSETWGGRNINFTVDSLGANRLINGSKCFLRANCTATKADGTNVLTADPIELREAAGNLLVETAQISIAGAQVFNDTFSVITRHFYERLSNTNYNRSSGAEADRYITGDAVAFDSPNVLINLGIRKTAISEGKVFMLSRPLTDMSFFGPRDAAIPALLPITMNFTLNSVPGRLFNTDDTITESPKLKIQTIELHIFSMTMEQSFAETFRDSLRTSSLTASTDRWATASIGSSISAAQSNFDFPSDVVVDTTPDILGICFMPNSSFNSTAPYKGKHPLTTNWLNTTDANILSNGRPIRLYRQLGNNADVGRKQDLSREMQEFSGHNGTVGLGRSAVDQLSFTSGTISFFPVAIRSISEETVLPPKPFSIKMSSTMSPNAGEIASVYMFYKARHQWQISSDPGQTRILK